MKIIPVSASWLLLLCSPVFAQGDSLKSDPLWFNYDRFWNNILEEKLTVASESEVNDQLENLSANPVDLNRASLDDLLGLPFLSYQEAKAILEYRKRSGRIFSVEELRLIKGFSNSHIDKLLPFLTASNYEVFPATSSALRDKEDNTSRPDIEIRFRMQSKLFNNKDVTDISYTGSPIKLYNRIKVSEKDRYQLGLILEKDAGEESFTDFSSFHLLLKELKPFENILLGDYSIEFGQGLALWAPYGFLREGDAVTSSRIKDKNIKPYLSSEENSFLRGAAFSLPIKDFTLTGFYSANSLDANTDSLSGKTVSLYTSGWHRNLRESLKKDRIRESLLGGRADYTFKDIFRAGVLYYHSRFSSPFLETSPISLSGNTFNIFSLSYSLFFHRLLLSGEIAIAGKRSAINNSLEAALSDDIEAVVSFRHYEAGFPSIHSFSSGSSSGCAKAETGIYSGLNLRTGSGTINLFYDQFKSQSRITSLPSNGNQAGIYYSVSPIEKLKLSLRYRGGSEEVCDIQESFPGTMFRKVHGFKAVLRYDFSGKLFMKLHGDLNRYLNPASGLNESGFAISQETGVSQKTGISNSSFSLLARITFFNTSSYYSRIYQAEIGMPGSLNSSMLYGKGFKWDINLRFKISSFLSVFLKYSEMYKSKAAAGNSGNGLPAYSSAEESANSLCFQTDVKF